MARFVGLFFVFCFSSIYIFVHQHVIKSFFFLSTWRKGERHGCKMSCLRLFFFLRIIVVRTFFSSAMKKKGKGKTHSRRGGEGKEHYRTCLHFMAVNDVYDVIDTNGAADETRRRAIAKGKTNSQNRQQPL